MWTVANAQQCLSLIRIKRHYRLKLAGAELQVVRFTDHNCGNVEQWPANSQILKVEKINLKSLGK
jgi:hypothetical protein